MGPTAPGEMGSFTLSRTDYPDIRIAAHLCILITLSSGEGLWEAGTGESKCLVLNAALVGLPAWWLVCALSADEFASA